MSKNFHKALSESLQHCSISSTFLRSLSNLTATSPVGSKPGSSGKYKRVIGRLGLNEAHRPHDARKTFITRAKKKGLDEFAIKRLVGHAISDITERVYTERDVSWLREEINKL